MSKTRKEIEKANYIWVDAVTKSNAHYLITSDFSRSKYTLWQESDTKWEKLQTAAAPDVFDKTMEAGDSPPKKSSRKSKTKSN